MTKTEKLVIKLYKKETTTIKIVATTGVSVSRVYSILSEHDMPLYSGQKAFRRIIALDTETEELLQQASPASISAWVCKQIKEDNR